MNTPPPRSWSTLLTKLGFNSKKYKSRTSANRARKLRFEQCEDRRLLAITVDVIHDIDDPNDGTTTLREALFTANSNLDHSTIHFDPTVFSTPQTIDLTEGELTIRKSVTIDAEGQGITVDASGNDPTPMLNNGDGSRVLAINMELNPEPRAVTLAGLTITGGDNSGNGGGLYFDSSAFPSGDVTLTIRDSVIEDNHSNSSGGGISLSNSTINLSNSHKLKIDILSSTIQNNSAFGAAEISYGPNVRGGGGIYVDVDGNNDNSEGVVFNLKDSTVSGNIAQRGEGGGVWFCAKYGGTFNAINSTISGNRAQDAASSAQGGGLWISRYDNDEEPKVLANLDSTTITNNFSPDGGGLFSDSQLLKNGGQAIVTKLNNTIVSANRIALDPNSAANNIAGKIKAASSYNFIGTSTAALPTGPGNITTNNTNGIDANNPGLLPLALNGGPTRTHAPLLSSPAVNAGKPLAVAGVDNVPLHDQRGETYDRVVGGRIDIGAVEIDSVHSELGAPQVENVVISGSNSEHEAYDFAAEMLASNWIAGDQLKTVPVGGADTIAITFSEGVTIDKSFLVLAGMNLVPSPSLVEDGFSYDSDTQTATWQYNDLVANDMYVLALSEEVADVEGNLLDGEWTNPASIYTTNVDVSEFPSGDISNTAGGDFKFVFTLLAGDASLNNIVNDGDIWIYIDSEFYSPPNQTFIFTTADFDGDGDVDQDDGTWISDNYGITLLQNLVLTADLTGDGIVDAADLWQLSLVYEYAVGEENAANFNVLYNALDDDTTIDLETLDIFSIHVMAQFGLVFVEDVNSI